MKRVKRASGRSEMQCLLFFSVALLLISPIETSDERAYVAGRTSVANASPAISDMRN